MINFHSEYEFTQEQLSYLTFFSRFLRKLDYDAGKHGKSNESIREEEEQSIFLHTAAVNASAAVSLEQHDVCKRSTLP